MKKLIDICFSVDNDIREPSDLPERYKEGLDYIKLLGNTFERSVVRHIHCDWESNSNEINYRFFKGRNTFWNIPLTTLRYLRSEKPDIVLIQGNNTPLQTILLKIVLHKQAVFIVQHHGGVPGKGIRKVFQQLADKYTDTYLFTALGNARVWHDKKIIEKGKQCFEVLEGSTYMARLSKEESRVVLQIQGDDVFLWVGRLDKEKDPLTVLLGFEKHLQEKPGAKLYMIYQEETLLPEIKAVINGSDLLKNAVHLVGKVAHEQLAHWYSAADFYLSGSYREGSGYALIEAMACGCIPVVTDIPPFRKITGGYGFLFEPGSPDSMYDALVQVSKVSKEATSMAIVDYFNSELSFRKIADDISRICTALTNK